VREELRAMTQQVHMTTTTTVLVAFLVLAAVVAIALVIVSRRRQSLRLQKHYGTEYDRAVEQHGGQSRAEAEPRKREVRVAKFKLLAVECGLGGKIQPGLEARAGSLCR
jgi:hypothetical protein